MQNHADHPVIRCVESLLRSIPERWADFDHDAIASTEQRALFLLVAAGLVERRIGVRGEFAGQGPTVEFTIDATGEYGLIEAMEPVAAEMWAAWGPAFEAWNAGGTKTTTPFRFTKTGLDRWRLTEFGVMARADLDIEAPSPEAAAIVGSYQRTIEFVTRSGHQTERPSVRGEGRLVEMQIRDAGEDEVPTPAPVSLANSEELAAAFRDLVVPAMAEALRGVSGSPSVPVSKTPAGDAGSEGFGDGDAASEPPSDMKPAVRRAGASFEKVEAEQPDLSPPANSAVRYTERQWSYIRDHYDEIYPPDASGRTTMPAFETWGRYVREYLRLTEGPKNSPRGGRPLGRSVVKQRDLDQSRRNADD